MSGQPTEQIELLKRALAFYERSPDGQYDEIAAEALRLRITALQSAQPAAEFAWPEPEPATVADVLAGIAEVERLMGIPQTGSSAGSEAPARGTEGYLHNAAEGPVLDRDALFEAIKGIPPMPTVEQMAERHGLKLDPQLCPLPFPDGPPMTTEQVAAMARAGYTIVSHSAAPTEMETLIVLAKRLEASGLIHDLSLPSETSRELSWTPTRLRGYYVDFIFDEDGKVSETRITC